MTRSDIAKAEVTVEALLAMGGPNLVYVRVSPRAELEGVVPSEMLSSGTTLYSIHTADGQRVAVMNDREAAFVAARQHDMVPVSVH